MTDLGIDSRDASPIKQALESFEDDVGEDSQRAREALRRLACRSQLEEALANGDDDAAVANLCANLDVEVGDASRVVSSRGEPYAVVHQYDRYDGVVRAVASRWPFAAS